MEHFVTLFDNLFVPQGLALHMSMERHVREYTLWILCVDDATYEVLSKCTLPNVRLLKLSQLETPELLNVKPGRTRGEYCWTLTPYAPRFVFEVDPTVERVTYLDADLYFCRSPSDIFDEFDASGKSVLITEHAYSPEYDQFTTSGRYCVQFMTFKRSGEEVRKWWEERCIEWCYARFEDGKFGDQKYLDEWPERFRSQVHVLRDLGAALAPWNATRFPCSNAVFYHFHGLRILSRHWVSVGGYKLPRPLVKNIYHPYLELLKEAVVVAEGAGWEFRPQGSLGIGDIARIVLRSVYVSLASFPRGIMRWL